MPSLDGRILQLSQDVVDKIAAGEVVVRPANAVKELIENCLDAKATEISVSIGGGGLEIIRIQDNGHGIMKDDLPIACQRFTTSKLQEYEDLRQINTYGFRGEALASISYVSNLTIITKTPEDKCANKAVYKNGELVGEICSSAGLKGTIIFVENLFYNMPHRLASLRQPAEEANRIADLIVRYAIHYPDVTFAYRRLDGNTYNFRSAGNGDKHGTIRALMHEKASRDLVDLEFHDASLHFSAKACLATPAAIFTSRAVQSRHDKMKLFYLFINGRAVECPRLQRAFDVVFSTNDALCPFITLALHIPPERVDVNVHPTKSVVHFLNEDGIIERIQKEFEQFLAEYRIRNTIPINGDDPTGDGSVVKSLLANPDRKTDRKRKATSMIAISGSPFGFGSPIPSTSSSSVSTPKVAPKDKIRVDYTNRTLDEFMLTRDDMANPLRPTSQVRILPLRANTDDADEKGREVATESPTVLDEEMEGEGKRASRIAGTKSSSRGQTSIHCQPSNSQLECIARHFNLDSLVELRREICRNVDRDLMGVFKRHLLIGFFNTRYSLIQSGPRVFLMRNDHVLRQFFYQFIIFSFGNMGAFDLVQSDNVGHFLPIRHLLRLYLVDDADNMTNERDEEDEELEAQIDQHCQTLVKHRGMLWDYFSIRILVNSSKKEGTDCSPLLASIPCLIDGYMPAPEGLPTLMFRLATQLDYSNEKSCFSGIAMALADFHVPTMDDDDERQDEYEEGNEEEGKNDDENAEEGEGGRKERREERENMHGRRAQRAMRAKILPAMRNRFLPGKDMAEHVQLLTSTAQAFKHFGRC